MKKIRSAAACLERFRSGWISNPAASLEFVCLVEAVLEADVREQVKIREWIREGKETAIYLGIKR